jgi:hypothetical protein
VEEEVIRDAVYQAAFSGALGGAAGGVIGAVLHRSWTEIGITALLCAACGGLGAAWATLRKLDDL